jgi:hypothetical protein
MHAGRIAIPTLVLLLIGLGLAACGGGDGSEPADRPVSVERDILPLDTDAAITTDLERHVAINPSPSAAARQRLFVMLPGTGGVPALYRLVVREGAARGYHTIGLNYPNGVAVGTLCQGDPDPDCHGKVRREVILGESTSPLVNVGAADSLVNRLRKLIIHLAALAPAEGWGQYLVGGEPDWSRITVAGHSQGGGHAGYMTRLFALDRAVYFAAPADWRAEANLPATWMTDLPAATGASRQYGFQHVDDALVPLPVAAANWRALGLSAFGATFSVDGATSPFGGSHQLSTAAAPRDGLGVSPTHGAPVLDEATPRTDSGAPLFAPVWAYLCFP